MGIAAGISTSGRQVQAWITKDKRVFIHKIRVFLGKDEDIISLAGKLVSKRTHRADDSADDWKIGVREISNMHGGYGPFHPC
jgi:hypothetical protein